MTYTGKQRINVMFKHIIATAIIATSLSMVSITAASADGGGADNETFASMTHADGSTTTSRYDRCCKRSTSRNRKVTTRNKRGRVVKVRKFRKNFNNGGRRTSRPWAENHTTGVTSIGIEPGLRVVIGGGGISLSF